MAKDAIEAIPITAKVANFNERMVNLLFTGLSINP
jgi:hypothetical protein